MYTSLQADWRLMYNYSTTEYSQLNVAGRQSFGKFTAEIQLTHLPHITVHCSGGAMTKVTGGPNLQSGTKFCQQTKL